jgi:acyl-CoA hydrolase
MKNTIDQSIIKCCRAVLPVTGIYIDTTANGHAMQIMEEVAFIATRKFSGSQSKPISSNKIEFIKSIPAGAILEVIAQIIHVANSMLNVKVQVFMDCTTAQNPELIASGNFCYDAQISEAQKPIIQSKQSESAEVIVGGEKELRACLNKRLSPKTIGRSTLYNYLEKLQIRKALYTQMDVDAIMAHVLNLRFSQKSITPRHEQSD